MPSIKNEDPQPAPEMPKKIKYSKVSQPAHHHGLGDLCRPRTPGPPRNPTLIRFDKTIIYICVCVYRRHTFAYTVPPWRICVKSPRSPKMMSM
jgi:hypothetical protein